MKWLISVCPIHMKFWEISFLFYGKYTKISDLGLKWQKNNFIYFVFSYNIKMAEIRTIVDIWNLSIFFIKLLLIFPRNFIWIEEIESIQFFKRKVPFFLEKPSWVLSDGSVCMYCINITETIFLKFYHWIL